ncbi:MAG: hypothetical protein ACFFDN_15095 [Candidatus Hodarchaeota archaeon]
MVFTSIALAEYNTIVTLLGCLCATVQVFTGYWVAYIKKKLALIKLNDSIFRAHRAFGSFATTFYYLGLFAGMMGFIGGIFFSTPPFEIEDPSFNIHVWPSFGVVVIITVKTYFSYFKKSYLYQKKRAKWLGMATFIAWAFTWLSSATSYYLRTVIPGTWDPTKQHPPPALLMPLWLYPLQLAIPFIIGSILGVLILRAAKKIEAEKAAKKSESKN